MAFRISGALAVLVCVTATVAEIAEFLHSSMNADSVSQVEQNDQMQEEETATEEMGLSVEAGQDFEEDEDMDQQAVKENMKTLEQEEEEGEDEEEDVLSEEDEDEEEDAQEKYLEKAEEEEQKADEGFEEEEEEMEDETSELNEQVHQVTGESDDVTSALQANVLVNTGDREHDTTTTSDHYEEGEHSGDEDEEQAFQDEDEEADNRDALHEVAEASSTTGNSFFEKGSLDEDSEESSNGPTVSMLSTGDHEGDLQQEGEWKEEFSALDVDEGKVTIGETPLKESEESEEDDEDEVPPEATADKLEQSSKKDDPIDMALIAPAQKAPAADMFDQLSEKASVVGDDPGILEDILREAMDAE